MLDSRNERGGHLSYINSTVGLVNINDPTESNRNGSYHVPGTKAAASWIINQTVGETFIDCSTPTSVSNPHSLVGVPSPQSSVHHGNFRPIANVQTQPNSLITERRVVSEELVNDCVSGSSGKSSSCNYTELVKTNETIERNKCAIQFRDGPVVSGEISLKISIPVISNTLQVASVPEQSLIDKRKAEWSKWDYCENLKKPKLTLDTSKPSEIDSHKKIQNGHLDYSPTYRSQSNTSSETSLNSDIQFSSKPELNGLPSVEPVISNIRTSPISTQSPLLSPTQTSDSEYTPTPSTVAGSLHNLQTEVSSIADSTAVSPIENPVSAVTGLRKLMDAYMTSPIAESSSTTTASTDDLSSYASGTALNLKSDSSIRADEDIIRSSIENEDATKRVPKLTKISFKFKPRALQVRAINHSPKRDKTVINPVTSLQTLSGLDQSTRPCDSPPQILTQHPKPIKSSDNLPHDIPATKSCPTQADPSANTTHAHPHGLVGLKHPGATTSKVSSSVLPELTDKRTMSSLCRTRPPQNIQRKLPDSLLILPNTHSRKIPQSIHRSDECTPLDMRRKLFSYSKEEGVVAPHPSGNVPEQSNRCVSGPLVIKRPQPLISNLTLDVLQLGILAQLNSLNSRQSISGQSSVSPVSRRSPVRLPNSPVRYPNSESVYQYRN